MPQPKSKKAVGLGNTLMNDRFGHGRGGDRKRVSAVTRVNHVTGEEYVFNDRPEAPSAKMRSVTEQGALDEFLSTAELAGADFAAERAGRVRIVHTDQQRNPYLLSAAEERAVLGRHRRLRTRLTVPRRPRWDASTTPEELDRRERAAFLDWRRGLAELQENQDLLMTPFERNLEVWRQLWRVIERSDVVVQIVDARNPLLFRSEDLEAYVKDVDPNKQNLLLINKADMMTYKQRKAWADYLKGANIAYKFFSAQLAKEQNEAQEFDDDEDDDEWEEIEKHDDGDDDDGKEGKEINKHDEDEADETEGSHDDEEEEDRQKLDVPQGANKEVPSRDHASIQETAGEPEEALDPDTQILTVNELESIFLQYAQDKTDGDRKLEVGLVGYPNVGKSSTINALIGAKKVSVSSTPGKTKHFQTIHLSDKVVLCDCPGLVFPNFATTKAELVCNGVLPIDQLREFSGPAQLVARRIPKPYIEAVYGIQIRTRPLEEGGTGNPTGEELLAAYALWRGFMTQGVGQPDQSRAARYVLKDYVAGKLLYCEPPPVEGLAKKSRGADFGAPRAEGDGPDDAIDLEARAARGREFNRELYDVMHLPENRRLVLAASAPDRTSLAGGEEGGRASIRDDLSLSALTADTAASAASAAPQGAKSAKLDKAFFKGGAGGAGHMRKPFNFQYTEQGQQQEKKQLSGRQMRAMIALETGLDPRDVQVVGGKKHFKGGQRARGKKRRNRNGEDE